METYSLKRTTAACRAQLQIAAASPNEIERPSDSDARFSEPGTSKLVSMASAMLRDRKGRANFVPGDLLGEPAWDILLELFVAEGHGRQIGAVDLHGTAISIGVAIRWIGVLEKAGLVRRDSQAIASDAISLTDKGFASIREYFAQRPGA